MLAEVGDVRGEAARGRDPQKDAIVTSHSVVSNQLLKFTTLLQASSPCLCYIAE